MDNLQFTLIPITLFVMIGVVTCSLAWLFYKSRQDHHETIRKALELGQPLDPNVLRIFSRNKTSSADDLRAGMISICIGVAFMVVACVNIFTDGDQYGSRIAGFIGILAVGFGVGQIIASKFASKSQSQADISSADQ
jgi:hypothetical protein